MNPSTSAHGYACGAPVTLIQENGDGAIIEPKVRCVKVNGNDTSAVRYCPPPPGFLGGGGGGSVSDVPGSFGAEAGAT